MASEDQELLAFFQSNMSIRILDEKFDPECVERSAASVDRSVVAAGFLYKAANHLAHLEVQDALLQVGRAHDELGRTDNRSAHLRWWCLTVQGAAATASERIGDAIQCHTLARDVATRFERDDLLPASIGHLALAYAELGEPSAAVRIVGELESGVVSRPLSPDARFAFAALADLAGEVVLANHLRTTHSHHSTSPALELASACLARGELAPARRILQQLRRTQTRPATRASEADVILCCLSAQVELELGRPAAAHAWARRGLDNLASGLPHRLGNQLFLQRAAAELDLGEPSLALTSIDALAGGQLNAQTRRTASRLGAEATSRLSMWEPALKWREEHARLERVTNFSANDSADLLARFAERGLVSLFSKDTAQRASDVGRATLDDRLRTGAVADEIRGRLTSLGLGADLMMTERAGGVPPAIQDALDAMAIRLSTLTEIDRSRYRAESGRITPVDPHEPLQAAATIVGRLVRSVQVPACEGTLDGTGPMVESNHDLLILLFVEVLITIATSAATKPVVTTSVAQRGQATDITFRTASDSPVEPNRRPAPVDVSLHMSHEQRLLADRLGCGLSYPDGNASTIVLSIPTRWPTSRPVEGLTSL